ncbi:MAG: glycoside hydrolase family 92 protein, partial [Cytophagales bacterium]|nr:glycoside hydrolase family 92 protein [Cytophagales bacterium]
KRNGKVVNGKKAEGDKLKAYLNFGKSNKPLLVKVGISAVSQEGAKKNLLAEIKDFDFETVRSSAVNSWSKILNKIAIETDDKDVKTNFYTALYHANIQPMVYHDVDGKYRGIDKKIHETKAFTNYTVFSLWDTFRALHPLMTIIDEERAADYVSSLLQKQQEGGMLPKWPLLANYTGTMVGYPAVSVIADAYAKGIAKDDINKALQASLKSSEYHPEWVEGKIEERAQRVMSRHNYFLNKQGYIPADSCHQSVSFGLENAYYDWCIAQLAKMANKKDIQKKYEKRSKYYSLYFDKNINFMRGIMADGSWRPDFSPRYSKHGQGDFTEGNSWQWTWFVPHDVEGLVDLFGSPQAFEAKLDTLFSTSSKIEGNSASGDITGLIGQYAHGNEPSHHISYLYNYIGKGYKTQQIVDSILYHYYKPTPEGICGNEDVGQMSSWYILNALGIYQVAPGNPTYTIGRPLIDRGSIQVKNGTFEIVVHNNSRTNKYVQKISLNGKTLSKPFFPHSALKSGGRLEITMGNKPKTTDAIAKK